MKRAKWLVTIWILAMLMSLALPVLAADDTVPVFQGMPILTNFAQQTLSGLAAPATLVEVLRGEKSQGYAVCDQQGSFSLEVILDEGENIFYAHIVNAQGFGPLSTPLLITLDTQAPSTPIWDSLGPIIEATQFVFGTTDPSCLVNILLDGQFAQQVYADEQGRFHTNLRLASGWHTLVAAAIDPAGNESAFSEPFSVFVPTMLAEYSQALDRLSTLGIMRGYADGTYRPYNPVTRAEFATLLDRTLSNANQLLASTQPIPLFSDVTPTSWAAASVGRLAASGCLVGFPDGTFHPDDWITGKEVIAAIVRAAGLEREAQAAREMLGNAPWYSGYSIVGAQHGLLYSNFSPDEKSLRGEVASSLSALVDFFARKGQTP